ncbi:hypothetical protein [Sinorhizobium meliloti]|uniref:hypothetical protein n=1 Tax=Rhizobium meliloti TaxID=382 RepID=UPI003F16D97F
MEGFRELRYDQLLPPEDDGDVGRRSDDRRKREQNRQSIEDTKRKIRAAFSGSEKVKASLRA